MRTPTRIARLAPLAILCASLPVAAHAAAARTPPAVTPEAPRVVEVARDPHVDSLLVQALDRMAGVVPGSDSLVAWELFRAHPQRTVDLIVPTLEPVKRDLWLGAPNMVWRVRVLQRLTGIEFRAPTRAKLSPEEKRHLAPDAAHGVRFAGELRAEGKTWTAPQDAQKAILAKWRGWWAMDEKKPELPVVKHVDDRAWWY